MWDAPVSEVAGAESQTSSLAKAEQQKQQQPGNAQALERAQDQQQQEDEQEQQDGVQAQAQATAVKPEPEDARSHAADDVAPGEDADDDDFTCRLLQRAGFGERGREWGDGTEDRVTTAEHVHKLIAAAGSAGIELKDVLKGLEEQQLKASGARQRVLWWHNQPDSCVVTRRIRFFFVLLGRAMTTAFNHAVLLMAQIVAVVLIMRPAS
jgi:hypothetical protein